MMRALSSRIGINLATRRLSFYEGDRQIKVYPVGVGKPATPTPTGRYKVVSKIVQPGGMLGTRWMGLSITIGNYGIHGTNNPPSIGGYVSNGCIRMYNHDVEELFPRVAIGTPVEITSGTTGTTAENIPDGSQQSGQVIHTVRAGESLWGIARQYQKGLSLIIRVNKITDPDVIIPGQKIIIP